MLPSYNHVKFLWSSSTLDMAIVEAQAMGYIYGIEVPCIQSLHVSLVSRLPFEF